MELIAELWQWISYVIDIFVHLDQHLNEWLAFCGPWIYVVLFLIIFCETGLVVTPFLPGDSLLFALGALTVGPDAALNIWVLMFLLTTAGIIGDAVNYAIGRHIGPRIFRSETSLLFNKEHLVRTQAFYNKYGGKTIIFARFMPIVRTFAPFVAGIGHMVYPRFAVYNVIGAIVWVNCFLWAGYYFGNLPAVRRNFHYVIVAIIILSVLPAVIEWIRTRKAR